MKQCVRIDIPVLWKKYKKKYLTSYSQILEHLLFFVDESLYNKVIIQLEYELDIKQKDAKVKQWIAQDKYYRKNRRKIIKRNTAYARGKRLNKKS